jgi:integrase
LLLIQQGESVVYVKEQLGHPSIQITVDVYGHLVPGGNRAAVDRLDDEPQPSATPAQPEVVPAGTSQTLSALDGVVSRVGIEPTTRRLRVRLGGVHWMPPFLFAQENLELSSA